MFAFHEVAAAAARYWVRHLDPRALRVTGLVDTLGNALVTSQRGGGRAVVLCSRPEAYASPGPELINVLALVAHVSGLELSDFDSARTVLYPDRSPELQLHPRGKIRPLLDEYPLSPPAPLAPGTIVFDPISQTFIVQLDGSDLNANDYEFVYAPMPGSGLY
jgi:hypothetical protein